MARRGILQWLLLISSCVLIHAQDDIREPPTITKPAAAAEKFYDVNDNVTLTCSATGTPKPMYTWYLNSQQIEPNPSSPISYDSLSGVLTIKKLTVSEEGFFDCRAKNTFSNGKTAVAISPKIEVRVARIDPMPKSPDRQKNVKEGNYVSLQCEENLPNYYGPTTFKWYTTDAEARLEELVPDERLFIDNKGTLHFSYAKRSDEKQNRFYACAMSNAIQGIIHLGGRTKLMVEALPGGLVEKKPVLQYSSKIAGRESLTFKRNSQARLECFFSGYINEAVKVPKMEWVDNANNVITRSSKFQFDRDGRVLIINNLVEGDEKPYTCRACLKICVEETMTLNVTSAPIFMKPLQALTVQEGEDAVLNCEARSASFEEPPNQPRWYRNGQRLDTFHDFNKFQFENEYRTLRVKATQKNGDIACFQCYVDNSVGEVFSSGCLNVVLALKVSYRPKEVQEIKEGDLVNLTVIASADRLYPLTFYWVFNNKTYEGANAPPYVTYDINTMTAFINTSGMSDEELKEIKGVYERHIYNKLDAKVVTVDVRIKDEGPVIVPIVEAGFDYWIIGLIIGILIIIIVIIIICCVICRRKMREGDYAVDRKETAAGLDPEKELKDSGFHDLSRADYDYLPEKKQPNIDIEEYPLADDESFGSEYAYDEGTAFNEDGSFIGEYTKKKPGGPPAYRNAESNV